jgi:putative transposase
MRYTTFRLSLDPTPAQEQLLARWAGASRFAYNQSLRLVTDALAAKRVDPSVTVPWSGLDLINAFNAWKKSEAAGRIFVVARDGTVAKQVTGLTWRHEAYAQVFEEAAVDCRAARPNDRRAGRIATRQDLVRHGPPPRQPLVRLPEHASPGPPSKAPPSVALGHGP